MPKLNAKCKQCKEPFYVCLNCDKTVVSREGYCSYECWMKQPLIDRLNQTGQYEAVEEIERLQAINNVSEK